MNVLMLCTKYSLDRRNPWLTDELARSLIALGYRVSVICLDWTLTTNETVVYENEQATERVLTIAPVVVRRFGPLFEKLAKWTLSSLMGWRNILKFVNNENYDLLQIGKIGFKFTHSPEFFNSFRIFCNYFCHSKLT